MFLQLTIDSPDQEGVTRSGVPMNFSVPFAARGSISSSFAVDITDDEDALENAEQYNLMFTGSTPSENVQLGSDAMFTITDEDSMLLDLYGSYAILNLTFILRCNCLFCGICLYGSRKPNRTSGYCTHKLKCTKSFHSWCPRK